MLYYQVASNDENIENNLKRRRSIEREKFLAGTPRDRLDYKPSQTA